MRSIKNGTTLIVRAIGGLHVVTLAWDFVVGQQSKHEGLLGFAIERTEVKNARVVERYYLRSMKRFLHKDEGLPPGTPVPTSEHPVQSFQWGDYTAKPATTYRYRVVPVYGKPKVLELDEASATTVEIQTESEAGHETAAGVPRHEIYFNRGVAGSQAYARKFAGLTPDEKDPQSEQMQWLSRGLFEALIRFIGLAAGADAADYELRAMLYEFSYLPVGLAFARAAEIGARVDIRYEAQTYKVENEAMIAEAKIGEICKGQQPRGGVRHNKFILLLRHGKPLAVWTGSTNISAGGIFGHSNVGHVIWSNDIAQRYLDYWERLTADDIKTAMLKDANVEVQATPGAGELPSVDELLTLFSPRDGKDAETLRWYSQLMSSAKGMTCIAFAFNIDDYFREVLLQKDGTLRYAVLDKKPDAEFDAQVKGVANTLIAPGALLTATDFETFLGEKLTGFNRNLYIHDKFMLLDPLGDAPLIVTGTANFSRASQSANDENMIVICGDTRVADIYFGEFMRIFDHLHLRSLVRKLRESGGNPPSTGFLKEDWKDWVPKHFTDDDPQSLRRRYFIGT